MAGLAATLLSAVSATGQQSAPLPGAPAPDLGVPSFWDPKRRQERPDLPSNTVIRFLSEADYPPFNYTGPDGNLTGFNVDLARMICDELRVACTVQMRRFDTLVDAVAENLGDAIIASIVATPEIRRRVDFTDPYYRSPARFVARRDSAINEILPERLDGTRVAVVTGTGHDAYLQAFFPGVDRRGYATAEEARQSLRAGQADLLFGDGTQLAFWLNGSDSAGCCAFRGGPFLESRYFGAGISIAVRRGNDTLRQALNYALFRLWERGRFTDIWLRHFPVSPF